MLHFLVVCVLMWFVHSCIVIFPTASFTHLSIIKTFSWIIPVTTSSAASLILHIYTLCCGSTVCHTVFFFVTLWTRISTSSCKLFIWVWLHSLAPQMSFVLSRLSSDSLHKRPLKWSEIPHIILFRISDPVNGLNSQSLVLFFKSITYELIVSDLPCTQVKNRCLKYIIFFLDSQYLWKNSSS